MLLKAMLQDEADSKSLSESWIDVTAQQPNATTQPPRLLVLDEESLSNTIRNPADRSFRRRRLTISGNPLILNLPRRPSSVDNSSQDEYEESESESDRVMTSSNEDIYHSTLASQIRRGSIAISDDEEEDGEEEEEGEEEDAEAEAEEDDLRETRNGAVSMQCFTPQPNAFSHPPPPSLTRHSEPVPGSYFPANTRTNQPSSAYRPTHASDTRRQTHTPYNVLSPNSTADHDALLRDSLSTLLSCAAAARGVPKSQRTQTRRADIVEPSTLRIVPEKVLNSTQPIADSVRDSPTTSSRSSSKGKGKRKTSSRSRSTSKDRQQQASKRPRSGSAVDMAVSPTLLTWCVAGGVVVLVSALSFSAGYVVGKEAGRLESATRLGQGGAGECGKEALRGGLGLRRWSGSSVAAAVGA